MDDRAAELNGGSYLAIPETSALRSIASLKRLVTRCIKSQTSFAIETTLSISVTFEHAALAKSARFTTQMRCVGLRDFVLNLLRVKARAFAGGYSAFEKTRRAIYTSSFANLPRALAEMDERWIYDNSAVGGPPQLVLEAERGEIRFLAKNPRAWLAAAVEL